MIPLNGPAKGSITWIGAQPFSRAGWKGGEAAAKDQREIQLLGPPPVDWWSWEVDVGVEPKIGFF